jgi:hypothetical protein
MSGRDEMNVPLLARPLLLLAVAVWPLHDAVDVALCP